MLQDILHRIYDALFNPDVKLQTVFPWNIRKLIKSYAIGTCWFFAGSFLPVVLLYGYIYLGAYYYPNLLEPLSDQHGHPHMWLLSGVVIASFLLGFGAELIYIRQLFRREGLSLSQSLALNLHSLKNSWSDALSYALWAFLLSKMLAALIALFPWPPVWDPAAEFAKQLSGAPLWGYVLIVVLAAPFFEEVVFRGFLFNALRSSFRQSRQLVTAGIATMSGITAFTITCMQPGNAVAITASLALVAAAALIARRVFTCINQDTGSDYLAIWLSGALFSAFHLNLLGAVFSLLKHGGVDMSWLDPSAFNLNLTVFPEILLMGVVLATLYRRSGTLICPMLLHGVNNLIAILVLCMTR